MRIRKRPVPLPLSVLSPVPNSTASDPTTSALLSSTVQLPPSTTSPAPQPNPKPKPPLLFDLNQPCPYSPDLDEPYIDINHHRRPSQLEEENEVEAYDLRLHDYEGAAADSKVPSSSSLSPPPRQDDDEDNNKYVVGTDDNDDGDNRDGERIPKARCEVEDRWEPKEEENNNENDNIPYKRCTNHHHNASVDNMVGAISEDSSRSGPAQPPLPPTASSTYHDDVNPDHTMTSGEPAVASPTTHHERWRPDADKTIPLKKRRSSFNINSSTTDSRALAIQEEDHCKPPPAPEEDGDVYYVYDNGREEDNNTNVMRVDIDENDNYNTNVGGNDHQCCTSTSELKFSATTIKVCNNATKKTTSRSNNDINTITIASNNNIMDGLSGGGGGGAKRRKKGKRGTGAVIMQGSRCSRVNGRGWRCCQPTLVGYSLCEHHLGKGRLRSVSTVRSCGGGATSSNLTATGTTNATTSLSSSTLLPSPLVQNSRKLLSAPPDDKKKMKKQQQGGPSRTKKKNNDHVVSVFSYDVDDSDDDDEDGGSKKRMKLGVVKARSLSSLLAQTNTLVVSNSAPMPVML